jgi:hypothetical protein
MPGFLATARSNKLPSANTGNVTAETIILGSDNLPLICPLEGSSVLNNRRFRLSISGHATSGTTSNLTIKLYLGTSATLANNGTAILSTGAMALASGSQNFFVDVLMNYDTVSQKIQGIFFGQGVNTLIALTALTATSLGSISDVAEGQGFTLTALFGSTNATNACVIDTFELIPE